LRERTKCCAKRLSIIFEGSTKTSFDLEILIETCLIILVNVFFVILEDSFTVTAVAVDPEKLVMKSKFGENSHAEIIIQVPTPVDSVHPENLQIIPNLQRSTQKTVKK